MKNRFIATIAATFLTGALLAQSFERNMFEGPGDDFFTQYRWADFNGDGAYDILEISFYSEATLHISEGAAFKSTALSFQGLHFEDDRYALHDYDGDGDIDLLATQEHSLVIVNNDGKNGFSLVNTGITFNDAERGKIYWVDVDGDLTLDIIQGLEIYLYRQGVYSKSRFHLPEILSNMVMEDINGDGLNDLVAGDYESYDGTELRVILNQGDGLFAPTDIRLPGTKLISSTITLLDVDGDADIDVFAVDTYDRGLIFKNSLSQTGELTFTSHEIFSGINISEAQAGDINSDGLQDLVVAGRTSTVVLKNTSTVTNISFTKEIYDEQIDNFLSFGLVDRDGDHDLDISVKGYSNDNGSVNVLYTKTGAPAGAVPSPPVDLSSIATDHISLSWTATPGLLYNIEVKQNGVIYKPSATATAGNLLIPDKGFLRRNGTLDLRGLPAGNYEWRAQALSPSGRSSAFSAAKTFSIQGGPSSLTVDASSLAKVKLCWTYNGANNPSFRIFRGTSTEAAIEIAEVGAGDNCYEDNVVPVNQIATYFVVAVDGNAYSAPSNTVTYHSTLFVKSSFGTVDPNIITSRCLPADYDLDGDYDLEFIGRIGSSYNNILLKNNGTGTFTSGSAPLTAESILLPYTEMSQPRDLDNDGDPDIVVITGQEYSWQKVSVFLNNKGTFVRGFETPAYLGIRQLIVEDMNNDGLPDLLFSNVEGNSPGNASVHQLLYQNTTGGFEDSHIVFIAAGTPSSAYFKCADLNSDGFMDILWTWADSRNIELLINENGTAFTKKSSILPATTFMGVADYNGDGFVDVMVRGNEGLNLYLGQENLTFREPKVIAVDGLPDSPTFLHADIDLNGLTDLILYNDYNSLIVLNKGNGSFKRSDIELQADWGSSIAITDFENDGDLDIVKMGNDSQHQGLNYFYTNQLAQTNVRNEPPAAPASLTGGYNNGLTVFNWAASTDDLTPTKLLTYNLEIKDAGGKVWLNAETNASGAFRRRLAPGNTGYSLTKAINKLPAGVYTARVQAIDASFKPSAWSQGIQVTIYEGPTALTVTRVLLNKVNITWVGSAFNETSVVVQRRTSSSNWTMLAELAKGATSYTDANLEYNTLYEYRVYEAAATEGTGMSNIASWNTNMWIMTDTNIANLYGYMDVADFTGDGRMDILANGGMIYNGYTEDITKATFENTDGGWIKRDVTPSTLPHIADIGFIDLNDDYKLDIYHQGYVWESGYKSETFQNNGDKTFSLVSNQLTNGAYSISSYFDIDMDNDLDITAISSVSGTKTLFKNNGGGNYQAAETISCSSCPVDVLIADFDADGDEDVIRYTGGSYQLYTNTPTGLVGTGVTFPAYDRRIAVTDYNDDGFPDVVLLSAGFYDVGRIYKNTGVNSSGFVEFTQLSVDLSAGDPSMLSADFDHDGRTDIVVLSPTVKVLLNKGNDTFQAYVEPSFSLSLHMGGLIDFDNDGDLDIYVSGYHIRNSYEYGRKAKIFLNQTIVSAGGIKNTPPPAPQNLTNRQDSLGVHLSWSKPVDDHTQPDGLTYDVVLLRNGKTITKGAHNPVTGQRLRLTPGRSAGIATLNNLQAGSYSWRVQAIDGSFAGSAMSAEGTFVFLPPPPIVSDTLIYKCGKTLTLTANGNSIRWYKDKALTQLLASGEFHPEQTQTVYVTQTVDGYEGIPKRVRITIFEKPMPPPPTAPYTVCGESSGSLYLYATGENIQWYGDQTLSNSLNNGNYFVAPATSTTYYVTQTIGDCESDATPMQISVTTIDANLYYTKDKIWTRAHDGDYFYWYKNGAYHAYTTIPNIPFDGIEATYVVNVTKGFCAKYSNPFITSEENITAVEESDEGSFDVIPNPASLDVTLRLHESNMATVNVIDALGHKVYSTSLTHNNDHTIDVRHWTKGIFIIVVDDGKKTYSRRLVIF